MLRLLRLTLCSLVLLAGACFTIEDARAEAITLNTSTVLLDSSNFTAGTTYYAAFQLVGGGTDNNSALLSNFNFGAGGSVVARSASDPFAGIFVLASDPFDPLGIGQTGATLGLTIIPGNAFSLFTQQFTAGSSFSFTFSLTNNFLPGNSFDGFTFQLYDASLGTLLFEQTFDINGAPQPVPEPATMLLFGTGLAACASLMRRHRKRGNH